MKQEPIIFRQGEENGIVVERDHFEHSIMLNQYQQAIDIFNRQWKQQSAIIEDLRKSNGRNNDIWIDNKFSNIIAFCGDRGEGKSSCMASFATMLTDASARKEALNSKETILVTDSQTHEAKEVSQKIFSDLDKLIGTEDIEWLDVIDPSFFDDQHNILELMLGKMYAKASLIKRSDENSDVQDVAYKRRRLMEQFQVVKNSICLLEPKEQVYDTISEMSDLAASIRLRSDIADLFKCYLEFMDKKCLLICVDDIDLNVRDAYKMSEMLRKYFVSPYCIVLVAVKVEQLEDVIANYHENKFQMSPVGCQQIAQKYVAKFLPRGNRIVMPVAEDFCERELQIADVEGMINNDDPVYAVKEKVVQVIFQKTGYVFYNTRYLSPIIPRNLRSLRHLLATLMSLPDARDENWDDNETGREVFKDYFFGTWVNNNLASSDRGFAEKVAHYYDLSTLNAFVIEYMENRVKGSGLENGGGKEDDFADLYKQITSPTNTAANISYGDVMYVLWMINSVTVDVDIQNLIFYLKTIYSMRLYACYNAITNSRSDLYPPVADSSVEVHIHQADRWYEHVNKLQRLVNGSYFTYPQGRLLPKTKGEQYRDKRLINFGVLKKWLAEIKGAYDKTTRELQSDKNLRLKICELMALYIVYTTISEENSSRTSNRMAKTPAHLWQFSKSAHYAIIDFLQPFYNLCNIEYAYRRFDNIMRDGDDLETYSLYNIALNTKDSLLHKLYNSSYSKKAEDDQMSDEELLWKKQHCLLSDAVIRITEVQWAIYDELLRSRDLHKSTDVLHLAYKDIRDLKIKLYALSREDNPEHKAHTLKFNFLPVLSSYFSKDYDIDPDKKTDAKRLEYETIQEWLKEIYIVDKRGLIKMKERIESTLKESLRQSQKGEDIRPIICDATDLEEPQKLLLAALLGNLFEDNKKYTYVAAKKKLSEVLVQYMTIKESSIE